MKKTVVLTYHDICKNPFSRYRLPVTEFIKHINVLTINKYHFVTCIADNVPTKSIMLTFDDGYKSIYTTVYPILKERNISATLFIYTNRISTNSREDAGMLTFQEIDDLINAGWSIQSHTVSHPNLTSLSAKAICSELEASKRFLENNLHIVVNSIAYPYGLFDQTVIRLAQKCGYEYGFTFNDARYNNSQFSINRISCETNVSNLFRRINEY